MHNQRSTKRRDFAHAHNFQWSDLKLRIGEVVGGGWWHKTSEVGDYLWTRKNSLWAGHVININYVLSGQTLLVTVELIALSLFPDIGQGHAASRASSAVCLVTMLSMRHWETFLPRLLTHWLLSVTEDHLHSDPSGRMPILLVLVFWVVTP
jgi:hypothetical protein